MVGSGGEQRGGGREGGVRAKGEEQWGTKPSTNNEEQNLPDDLKSMTSDSALRKALFTHYLSPPD